MTKTNEQIERNRQTAKAYYYRNREAILKRCKTKREMVNADPERRATYLKYHRERYRNLSPDGRKKYLAKRRDCTHRKLANMSPEQRAEHNRKRTDVERQRIASLSPEQRAELNARKARKRKDNQSQQIGDTNDKAREVTDQRP